MFDFLSSVSPKGTQQENTRISPFRRRRFLNQHLREREMKVHLKKLQAFIHRLPFLARHIPCNNYQDILSTSKWPLFMNILKSTRYCSCQKWCNYTKTTRAIHNALYVVGLELIKIWQSLWLFVLVSDLLVTLFLVRTKITVLKHYTITEPRAVQEYQAFMHCRLVALMLF